MKIAIIGTRGIPNHYGGFEQFAAFFSVYAAEKNHEVYVYTSANHPYQEKMYCGVHLIHISNPEDRIGKVGQFLYDLYCILDARKRNFDVILQLGYTSSSVWGWLLPKKPKIFTNMDGLEWKRSKYSKPVQTFLKRAEKWAIQTSDTLIADSVGIQEYLYKKHRKKAVYIAYGANVYSDYKPEVLESFHVKPFQFNMLIARMEPENNIEMILEGVVGAEKKQHFLVIGNHEATHFGQKMYAKYKDVSHIHFLGSIYDQAKLNHLRNYSNLYFHGHSVGGTNPSLLEAMGTNALIVAHDNIFNQSILEQDAFYFKNNVEISTFIDTIDKTKEQEKLTNNTQKIQSKFHWDCINEQYLTLLTGL